MIDKSTSWNALGFEVMMQAKGHIIKWKGVVDSLEMKLDAADRQVERRCCISAANLTINLSYPIRQPVSHHQVVGFSCIIDEK